MFSQSGFITYILIYIIFDIPLGNKVEIFTNINFFNQLQNYGAIMHSLTIINSDLVHGILLQVEGALGDQKNIAVSLTMTESHCFLVPNQGWKNI